MEGSYLDSIHPMKECAVCYSKFRIKHENHKICSNVCRAKKIVDTRPTLGGKNNIPTPTVGAISEMRVAADLMKQGYSVFRALSPACFCDLIAVKRDKVMQIEVRTGYLAKTYGVQADGFKFHYPKKLHTTNGVPTHYGVYVYEKDQVVYEEVTELDLERNGIETPEVFGEKVAL